MEKTHPLADEESAPAPPVCRGTLAEGTYCGACPKCRSEIDWLVRRMARLTGHRVTPHEEAAQPDGR